jgi:multidrug efflux pump subunit AcrB/outer membrane protein TolC
MENQLKKLKAECRKIPAVSKIKDYGIQKEKIYVNVEPEKLNEYNIKSLSLLSAYMPNGMISPAGKLKNESNYLFVHFPANFESEKDLSDQIVFSDPTGGVVRLKDIAKIERRDEDPDSYIRQDGKKTILLSLEMQTGNNIVQFGKDVEKALEVFKKQCPNDIQVKVISNLPQYVDDSVTNFMHEFLIAIIAVIFVVMLLLPKKVASIAGLTVPIAVLISLGVLYFLGVELNTVSLAGLIIVLGMIVDNSIVVIDNYVEKKDQGMSSWHAALKSARELVTPIFTATLAICVVYIPLGIMIPGTAGDFLHVLPITICVALLVSVLVALFVVPYLNFLFIKKGLKSTDSRIEKKTFLDRMQEVFDASLEKAFRNKKVTIGLGIASIILAIVLFINLDQQLFPTVERNQCAVEVFLDRGSSLESTEKVIAKLENTLKKDKRVTTVTSFIGTSSPRFHMAYAPNMPSPNFGQLLINTTTNDATVEICDEYNRKFSGVFPNAHIKFKRLALAPSRYPIELRISGESIADLRKVEDQIDSIARPIKEITWIRSDWEQKDQNILVDLDKDKATRMGYSKGIVATSLMMGLNGIPLTTIWEGDYPVAVELTQDKEKRKDLNFLGDQTITSPMSFASTPLRSFAKFSPQWTEGNIVHRNGTRTLTVQLDMDAKTISSNILSKIKPQLDKLKLPQGVSLSYGGEVEGQMESFVPMGNALVLSIVIIFFILLFQFKKVKLATLIMSTMLLSLPGAAIGLTLMRYPFSLTGFIGITSLCGIVVRNGIILIDYLQELRTLHGMSVGEAALAAGKRRMRPIFLTSAAAAVGVIPMIISRSPLWGPLGTIICFGLLISMVLTLFILPVLYTIIYSDKKNGKSIKKYIPYSNIKKSIPVIILFVMIGTSLPSVSQVQNRTLSIDSCKTLALNNNKTIKNADFDVQASLETKKGAFTNYFPKVSASAIAMKSADYLIKGTIPSMNLPVYDGNLANLASATQFAYIPEIPINALDYMNMASITITQPIFTGGRIINGNKLAKIGYEVNRQKKMMSTTEVLVKTENLYWNAVALQNKLTTLNGYEMLLNQLLSDVNVAIKAGLAQRSDLLKVQLKLNEVKMNKMKLGNGISLSTRALCQHIGIPYDSTLVLVQPLAPTALPQYENADAVKNRYEYQLLNKALEAEKLQKRMVLGEYLPQVALVGVGYTTDVMKTTKTSAMALVSVSIPISDWWGGSHKIKESQIKIQQANNKLNETTELLNLQIEQAKNELNETRFQIITSQASIDQSKENLKVVNDNYKAGVSSISDLLEAQALFQDAKNQFSDAVCMYKIKVANYRSVTGMYK